MKVWYVSFLDFSNPRPLGGICFASISTKICSRPGSDGPELNLTPASASFCVPSENFANSEDSSHEIIETFALVMIFLLFSLQSATFERLSIISFGNVFCVFFYEMSRARNQSDNMKLSKTFQYSNALAKHCT
jgi:hypothetical protein